MKRSAHARELEAGRIPALVLDAHRKSSLTAIRSLGERGISVIAGSHRRSAMGLYSRSVAHRFVYPSPLHNRSEFVASVLSKVEEIGQVVLLVFSDSTLLPLVETNASSRHRLLYQLPSAEYFRAAFDKASTLSLAREIGVHTPATHLCSKIADISSLAHRLTYPVVIKPRRSVWWDGECGIQRTATFAFSADDLIEKCQSVLLCMREFPLIQEYIRGPELGVELLCDNGNILAACAHRRIRSLSPIGGASVLAETVPLTYSGIGDLAQRIVARLHWSGPIMIEFKIDEKTHTPSLMETNGRFWGSLPLAVAAGVDFPYLFYRYVCGERLLSNLTYQEGASWRHVLGDFNNLTHVLARRDPMRRFAYPSRFAAVKSFLRPSGSRTRLANVMDIKPAIMEILDSISVTFSGFADHF